MNRVWLYTFSLTRARLEGLFPNPANQNLLRVISNEPSADDLIVVCRECGAARSRDRCAMAPDTPGPPSRGAR